MGEGVDQSEPVAIVQDCLVSIVEKQRHQSRPVEKQRSQSCLKPIFIALTFLFLSLSVNANAQENMKFDTEAEKLEFIRQMLSNEKKLRLVEITSPPYCNGMMKDLLAGENFKAIEPDVRADSMDDPRLAKWNQCREKDYHDVDVDADRFFGWLPQLGDPPYRYYRIEFDGNPDNGPEDMIYHEPRHENPGETQTGYTWVDLSRCEIRGGFVVTSSTSNWSMKPHAIYLNSLVYYNEKLWAADFVDGFDFEISRWVDRDRMEICRWRLFDPNKSE